MTDTYAPSQNSAGLANDPIEFVAMTEISIISHLAENLFASVLPEDLTVAQFGVLNHLLRLGRQETIGELASAMQVTQPTMSSTVKKLEEKGCLRLVADEKDQRVRRTQVTPLGKDRRAEAMANIAPIRDLISQQLSDGEWKVLLPILTKLRITMDNNR
ncbi:MAG: MarR family transcriptional regulator [Pseudomonadota bacterium]